MTAGVSEMDDITKARIKRCVAETPVATDNDKFHQAIEECAVAELAYECAFEYAASVVCASFGAGVSAMENIFGDAHDFNHDCVHAMSAGLVRKLIDDRKDALREDDLPDRLPDDDDV